MARTRSLKPGFFHDVDLIALPPLARLLFAGIWCYADREGRLEDNPRQIRHDILPGDRCDIDKLLAQLAAGENPYIVRYQSGARRYIQIRTFKKHQNPHVKEPASTIPAPDKSGASPRQEPDEPSKNPASRAEPITGNGLPSPELVIGTGLPEPEIVGLVPEIVGNGGSEERAVFRELEAIYIAAGVPVSDKHKDLCRQYISDIPPEKLYRLLNYVKWSFATGRWHDPKTTKGLLSLLQSGDWDVEITPRVLPTPHPKSKSELGQEAAERMFTEGKR